MSLSGEFWRKPGVQYVADEDETKHRRIPPRTRLSIYRLGRPIPYPTSLAEFREQLDWYMEQWHRDHHAHVESGTCDSVDDKANVSDMCRMRAALRDPRFRCPDEWHLRYQPDPGGCSTCHLNWIAVDDGWAPKKPNPEFE